MGYSKEVFAPLIESFYNDDIRDFARACLDIVPEYFWTVPASSSGKYHPMYALGDGGLVRHTLALCRIMKYILDLQCMGNVYMEREAELMLVAGMMHDTYKSGSDGDYTKSKYTKFNHPLLAANAVRGVKGYIKKEEVEFCAHCIESHMGEWNKDKRSNMVLPKPEDKYQILVHISDYLASRKDITLSFDDLNYKAPEIPAANDWVIDFGKYKGYTLEQVVKMDPDYVSWAKDNVTREPARTILASLQL